MKEEKIDDFLYHDSFVKWGIDDWIHGYSDYIWLWWFMFVNFIHFNWYEV